MYFNKKGYDSDKEMIPLRIVSGGKGWVLEMGSLFLIFNELHEIPCEEGIRFEMERRRQHYSAPFLGGMTGPFVQREEDLTNGPVIQKAENIQSISRLQYQGKHENNSILSKAIKLVTKSDHLDSDKHALGPLLILVDLREFEKSGWHFSWKNCYQESCSILFSDTKSGGNLEVLRQVTKPAAIINPGWIFMDYPYLLVSGDHLTLKFRNLSGAVVESIQFNE